MIAEWFHTVGLRRGSDRGSRSRFDYRFASVLLVVLAAGAIAPATVAEAPPRTIAVGRLEVDHGVATLRERARRVFEGMIEQHLRGAGYTVVPVDETDAIWRGLRDSLGGFYDSYTGRVVPERYRAVHEGTKRALLERRGVDAWLQPSLETFRLPFGGDKAEWHGTSQETGGRGGLSGFLIGRSSGTLVATSLVVTLEDTRDGAVLYRRAGGLELTTKVGSGGLVSSPADSLLRDDARNVAAVGLALDSLVTRWPVRPSAP